MGCLEMFNKSKRYCYECKGIIISADEMKEFNIPYGYCSPACYLKEKMREEHKKTWSD